MTMIQFLHQSFYTIILAMIFAYSSIGSVYGIDAIIFPAPASANDHRRDYSVGLLQELLRRTEPKYGPSGFKFSSNYMVRSRIFIEMKSGEKVNVVANPVNPEWNENLISISIPVDMGVQSWRIALIDEKKQNLLRNVRSLEELKPLRVGASRDWVTFQSLVDHGFNVIQGDNYDGLFEMLKLNRFDYFLRGINEIFDEFNLRKDSYKNLAVEDSFILHDSIPSVFYVSPKFPRLAERIQEGMEAMVSDGSLKRFVLKHYQDKFKRAKICQRRIFEIPYRSNSPVLLARKELWLDPFDPKNGICAARPLNREGVH